MKNNVCKNCGKEILVMAFRDEDFCSDNCRKEMGRDLVNPYGGRTA